MVGKDIPQFNLDAGKVKPPAAPEQKPSTAAEKSADAVPAIGDAMAKEFKTDGEKSILGNEFQKTLSEKFNQFTKEFQAKFCDAKGQPDLQKILGLFGLDKLLGPYVQPGGESGGPGTAETAEASAADSKSGQHAAKTGPNAPLSFGSAGADIPSGNGKVPENPGTMTGSKFLEQIKQIGDLNHNLENQHKMEMMIAAEVAKGNIPSFCRPENGKTIGMKGPDGTIVKFKAGRDYLAIGTDSDFIRVPMTPVLAQTLSEQYGWGLPTGPMTDAIHDTAEIKIKGVGYVRDGHPEDQAQMQGTGFIARHNYEINQTLGPQALADLKSGKSLAAGFKKDLIIAPGAVGNPRGPLYFRGLYGDGVNPTQHHPAHEWSYYDYSHGFRPIYGNVVIIHPNGQSESKPYYEALKDPIFASALNGAEGAFDAEMAYRDPRKGRPAKKSAPPTNIS